MHKGEVYDALPSSYQVLPLPVSVHNFIEEVKTMLVKKDVLSPTDISLEKLHEVLPLKDKVWDNLLFNQVDKQFYLLEGTFMNHYELLIKEIAQTIVAFDFLFQKQPIVRFHFPERFPNSKITHSGWAHDLHSDLLGGHPPNMIQFWIPLVECNHSNTLHLSDRTRGKEILEKVYAENATHQGSNLLSHFAKKIDKDVDFQQWVKNSCNPILLDLGQILVFDPHCIHGPIENKESTTRVSIDFRIIPLPKNEKNLSPAWIDQYPRFIRGDIMHSQSAGELD